MVSVSVIENLTSRDAMIRIHDYTLTVGAMQLLSVKFAGNIRTFLCS